MPLSGSASAASSTALSTTEFSECMRAAGLCSGDTAVAVGVSGGADSMTLLALAHDWAVKTGAVLSALTVDHRLRPDSGAEAAQVAAWCRARGIAHHTLVWTGNKPDKGIQAAARAARYDLLENWCRAQDYDALLVAHSLNDQAETFLMRMSHGSGIDGLAAMPLVSQRDGLRLVRPLLGVPRARIEATVAARSLDTVSDPSNLDRAFARIRMRDKVKLLDAQGISAEAIAGAAHIFGTLRAARERAIDALAGEIAILHPPGYAEIGRDGLIDADPDIARGLVSAVIQSVGGRAYPPRRDGLERLFADILRKPEFRPRTLGNCVVSIRRGHFLIRREHRTIRDVAPVVAGGRVVWDGRFIVGFAANPPSAPSGAGADGYRLGALGEDGWQDIVTLSARVDLAEWRDFPGPVRYALPAIRAGKKVVEVPHLQYRSPQLIENIVEKIEFRWRSALSGHPFWVA